MSKPSSPFRDIVEVVETNWAKANLYLDHGYRLLGFSNSTDYVKASGAAPGHVRRRTRCILGRTADVLHFDPAEVAEAAEVTP